MHATSSYRGNSPTNKQTHRQEQLQYTALQLARSVIIAFGPSISSVLHFQTNRFNSYGLSVMSIFTIQQYSFAR